MPRSPYDDFDTQIQSDEFEWEREFLEWCYSQNILREDDDNEM